MDTEELLEKARKEKDIDKKRLLVSSIPLYIHAYQVLEGKELIVKYRRITYSVDEYGSICKHIDDIQI
jgi:hypothetical protein